MIYSQHSAEVFLQAESSFLGSASGSLYRLDIASCNVKPASSEVKRMGFRRIVSGIAKVNPRWQISITKNLSLSDADLLLFNGILQDNGAGNLVALNNLPGASLKLFVELAGKSFEMFEGVSVSRITMNIRPREGLVLQVDLIASKLTTATSAQKGVSVPIAEPLMLVRSDVTSLTAGTAPVSDMNIILDAPANIVFGSEGPTGILRDDLRVTANYSEYVTGLNTNTLKALAISATMGFTLAKNSRQFVFAASGCPWADEPVKNAGDLVRQVNFDMPGFTLTFI